MTWIISSVVMTPSDKGKYAYEISESYRDIDQKMIELNDKLLLTTNLIIMVNNVYSLLGNHDPCS